MIAYLVYGGLAIGLARFAGQRSRFAIGLLAVAIGLRVAFGFFEHSIVVFDDERFYMESSAKLSVDWMGWHENRWAKVASIHNRIFGEVLHPMRALNIFLAIVMALLMRRIARLLHAPSKTEEYVYYFGLFGPPMLFLGGNILKEQAMAVVLGIIVLGLLERGQRRPWILTLGLISLWIVRSKLLPIAVAGIFILGIYTHFDFYRKASLRVKLAIGSASVVCVFLCCTVFGHLLIYSAVGKYVTAFMGMPSYEMSMQDLPALHSSTAKVGEWLDKENAFTLRNLGVLSVRNLYSPGLCQFIADPSREQGLYCFAANIWWWVALPFFVVRLMSTHEVLYRHLAVVLVIGAMYLIATATDLTVFQQSWRYRWAIWPVFFTVAIIGLLEPSNWKIRVNLVWWTSVAVFCAVYFW